MKKKNEKKTKKMKKKNGKKNEEASRKSFFWQFSETFVFFRFFHFFRFFLYFFFSLPCPLNQKRKKNEKKKRKKNEDASRKGSSGQFLRNIFKAKDGKGAKTKKPTTKKMKRLWEKTPFGNSWRQFKGQGIVNTGQHEKNEKKLKMTKTKTKRLRKWRWQGHLHMMANCKKHDNENYTWSDIEENENDNFTWSENEKNDNHNFTQSENETQTNMIISHDQRMKKKIIISHNRRMKKNKNQHFRWSENDKNMEKRMKSKTKKKWKKILGPDSVCGCKILIKLHYITPFPGSKASRGRQRRAGRPRSLLRVSSSPLSGTLPQSDKQVVTNPAVHHGSCSFLVTSLVLYPFLPFCFSVGWFHLARPIPSGPVCHAVCKV